MKRFLAFLVALLTTFYLISPAHAVIAPKLMTQFAQVDPAASGLVLSGTQIMIYGNREKNGFVQVVGGTPVDLNCGVESFISAATTDSDGNFVLVGAGSNPIVGTLPPISGVLNPDNVVPDPVSSNKSDANNLCYWKLDSTGKLIDSNTFLMPQAIIPNSVVADKFGITVAGTSFADPGFNGFLLNLNGKSTYIGKLSTQIFGIARTSDGGVIAVGQSSEKLLDKNLKGKADGFLAKLLNGKLVSVQRSSDIKATRAWKSVTSSLLLGGYSNTSAVITKFSANFVPTWTDRYPANGSAKTAGVGKLSYGAFVSTGPFKSLPSWKRKNATLLLTFDAKGIIAAANYINSDKFNALAANSASGPIVLAGGFLYRA